MSESVQSRRAACRSAVGSCRAFQSLPPADVFEQIRHAPSKNGNRRRYKNIILLFEPIVKKRRENGILSGKHSVFVRSTQKNAFPFDIPIALNINLVKVMYVCMKVMYVCMKIMYNYGLTKCRDYAMIRAWTKQHKKRGN